MSEVNPFNLPFEEAITFLKKKLDLPTATWDAINNEMHKQAFTVAGAMEVDLLADFHDAINKMLQEGLTLEDFRKEFDSIVARNGWDYKGSRGWRSNVIYQTNLQGAYQEGRYQQANEPEILSTYPYWRYRTAGDANVRPLHQLWNNTVLRADDPWWETHYPYRGNKYLWYNCRCDVEVLTENEYKALIGKAGYRTEPPIESNFMEMEELCLA